MAGFLSKIFGGGKKKSEAIAVIEETLQGVIEKSNLELSFDVKDADDDGVYQVEIFGSDEDLIKDREGQLLDAFQLYMTRVLQHQLPEERVNIEFDCNGFREEINQELIDLAEKLKDIALTKKKSVYFRALPPKERKVVHQYLADDERVKSRSIGEGLYKKIKIFPADMKQSGGNGGGGGRRGNRGRNNRRDRNNGDRNGNRQHQNSSKNVDSESSAETVQA